MSASEHTASFPNLAALASWIEDPCHFQTTEDALKNFASTKSFHYINAMHDLLQSDSEQSYKIEVGQRGLSDSLSESVMDGAPSSTSLPPTEAPLSPDLGHHSITKLLEEYYKLVDRPCGVRSSSVSNVYRPPMTVQLWERATQRLPYQWRILEATSRFHGFVKRTAPEDRLSIIGTILVWLCIVKMLLLMPFVDPAVPMMAMLFGFYVSFLSDRKLKGALERETETRQGLVAFDVDAYSSLPSTAVDYLKMQST